MNAPAMQPTVLYSGDPSTLPRFSAPASPDAAAGSTADASGAPARPRRRLVLMVTAGVLALGACGGRDSKALDDALRNDLNMAAMAPSMRQAYVSPAELGYPAGYAPPGYGYPAPYPQGGYPAPYPAPGYPQAAYPAPYPPPVYPQPVAYPAPARAPQQVVYRAPAPSGGGAVGSGSGGAGSGAAGTGPVTESNTQRGAIIGAATGAAVGIATSRDKVKGGAVGAVTGAVLGGVVGSQIYTQPRSQRRN